MNINMSWIAIKQRFKVEIKEYYVPVRKIMKIDKYPFREKIEEDNVVGMWDINLWKSWKLTMLFDNRYAKD